MPKPVNNISFILANLEKLCTLVQPIDINSLDCLNRELSKSFASYNRLWINCCELGSSGDFHFIGFNLSPVMGVPGYQAYSLWTTVNGRDVFPCRKASPASCKLKLKTKFIPSNTSCWVAELKTSPIASTLALVWQHCIPSIYLNFIIYCKALQLFFCMYCALNNTSPFSIHIFY